MDYDSIKLRRECFVSSDIEKKILSIEHCFEQINKDLEIIVSQLEDSESHFLVAERIFPFGTLAIPHLEKFFQKTSNKDAKILCALNLTSLGVEGYEGLLLESIQDLHAFSSLSARTLHAQGNAALVDLLRKKLVETCDHEDYNEYSWTFLELLQKMDALDEGLKKRLQASQFDSHFLTIFKQS